MKNPNGKYLKFDNICNIYKFNNYIKIIKVELIIHENNFIL